MFSLNLSGCSQEAHSCSVPVFRYAIERWKPDPYKGIYIYQNEIKDEDRVLLGRLKLAASNPDYPLNLLIKEVNTATFSKEKLNDLLKGPVPETFPTIVIWYPGQMNKKPPFLIKQFTPSFVEALVQSPKRKEMAERLINGDSVVWIFIQSGIKQKDEKARILIREELDKAVETYAKTPFTILSGSKQKKLIYSFPIMTMSRDDPAESVFVEMLMKTEPDLYDHIDEPMVFPVFGRGRVLGCLYGKYISEKNIKEASSFLSGACSCEVKELNPGVDLLVTAPWDIVVMNSFVVDDPLPELTGVMPEPGEAEDSVVSGVTSLLNDVTPVTPDNNSGLIAIYGITLMVVIMVVGITGFIISRRRRDK